MEVRKYFLLHGNADVSWSLHLCVFTNMLCSLYQSLYSMSQTTKWEETAIQESSGPKGWTYLQNNKLYHEISGISSEPLSHVCWPNKILMGPQRERIIGSLSLERP